MKSIKTQYIDLMEGRMSQHNFMRSLRMTLPQYITNVTSFKDSVKILKNKGILSEAMGGDPIEATLKSYLAKGNSYAEAIELTAAEQGMDEEVLMSQYPQDAVDTEGYEDDDEDDEFIDMISRAEEEEAGKYTKNYDFPGGLGEGDIDEAENTSLRNPIMAAKAVARKHSTKLQSLQSDFKQFERAAIQLAGEEMLASGMDKVAIRNLLSGYGSFEDWIQDYIDALDEELNIPEDEAPEDYVDPDMFDGYGMDASEGKLSKADKDKLDEYEHTYRKVDGVCYKIDDEGNRTRVADHYCRYGEGLNEAKKKRKPKAELHPNQIHPQELRMGIKVELEHTDDLDKAKKIALDHLAENPFYYTALKLAGVESPSVPKYKAPVAFKKEVTAAVELVDKINAMKPVKGFEKAKASSNKAKKETNSGVKGVSELTHNAQTVRGLQKFAATGGKMKTIKLKEDYESFLAQKRGEEARAKRIMQATNAEGVKFSVNDIVTAPDGKEIKITGFTTGKDGKMKAMYDAGMFASVYNLDDLEKKSSFRPGVDLGASFDKLKSSLEEIVREVLNEIYDGRDDMNEEESLDSKEQELVDAVLGDINEEINLGKILAKAKLLASKGLLTAAMASVILTSCGESANDTFKRELDNAKKVQDLEQVQQAKIDSVTNSMNTGVYK